ncbi:MAG: sigma-70 family RNA polymerase sigma factor [bacterium]|nr:sigma-70 family RNA polymerase sigma factor [bacterium]
MTAPPAAAADAVFAAHERHLWALCYRMSGVAADADDLVQETFLRFVERPPRDPAGPLRPWLVRVAMNLARDLLRRRRRRRYVGPWLPAAVETDAAEASVHEPSHEPASTEGRYDLLESVGFAFLLALEALTPQQRAVLLLRDVFDYPVRAAAAALGTSEANVKVLHHRARRRMAAYDRTRRPPTRDLADATRVALVTFVAGITRGDVAAVEALLAADVRAISDGAGEFHAARRIVVGRTRVARFFIGLARRRPATLATTLRTVNGLPALVVEFGPGLRGDPPRGVIRLDLDADGRIAAVHAVLATRKLAAVRFADPPPVGR